jgi:hypothetical protein
VRGLCRFLLTGMDGRGAYKPRDGGPVAFLSIQTSRNIRHYLFTQTASSLWHLKPHTQPIPPRLPHIQHSDVRHELVPGQHTSRLLWQRWCWQYPYAIHSCPWLVCLADISQEAPRKPHCPRLRQDTRSAGAAALGARPAQLRAPRRRPSCLAASSTCFPNRTKQPRARRICCRP